MHSRPYVRTLALFTDCLLTDSNSARQHFGNLQHKIFPIYFVISIILSAFLLVLWTFSHPDVMTHTTQPNVADVAQAYALTTVLLCQGLNYFVIGPMTSKCVLSQGSARLADVKFLERCSDVTVWKRRKAKLITSQGYDLQYIIFCTDY